MPLIHPLMTAFLLRFAWAMRPFAESLVEFHTWCHPRHGIVGTHALDANRRCKSCKRKVVA